MPLTVGTAGHVDHGKTWLVRALTGKDTDRLPEERARGISIDLGYAPLELPSGRRLSLVDVPGHERFVRTMVAGATGIDLFLIVVDGGEGARRQTHEHLAILRLLGVTRGVVAVTKADAVEPETLELAVEEARELAPGAPVVAVSAKTGSGIPELLRALEEEALRVEHTRQEHPARLFVDRAFTLAGVGTVATGTLWSGRIGAGDELRLEPGGGDVRVRSVQVHDRDVDAAEAGQRVAVALPGIDRKRLRRGQALVEPGGFAVTFRVDVALEELEPVPDGARLTVHHGTSEVRAQVRREGRFAQLRLSAPLVAARGDRVILRAETTVAGGRIVDPLPPRRLDDARLAVLEQGDPVAIVRATVDEPVTAAALAARGLLTPEELARGLATLVQAGDWYLPPEWLERVRADVRRRLADRAREAPLEPGIPLGELLPAQPWAAAVAPLLHVERRRGKAYLPGVVESVGERADAAAALDAELALAGVQGARVDDRDLAAFLERAGRLVRLGDGFAVSPAAYEEARRTLVEEAARAGAVRLARFRDLLGVSRRSAQLLLERFDSDGVTRRVGDERVLRRRASRPD